MRTETQTKVENKALEIFSKIHISDNAIFIPLEDNKTKVKNIDRLKDYLNTNIKLYCLEVIFVGGLEQDYKTALKIKLIN